MNVTFLAPRPPVELECSREMSANTLSSPLCFVLQVYADKILDYRIDADPSLVLSADIAKAIESLWHDPIIPSVLDRQSEFYLMDSAP